MQPLAASTIPVVPSSDLFRLEQRTILITGGCGGVGSTVTEALLEAGADVVVTDLPAEPPPTIWSPLKEKANQTARQLSYYQLDTTDAARVQDVFDQADSSYPHPLRGLVTCAAISERIDAIDYPLDRFKQIFNVNVHGSFLCAQAAARTMRRRGVAAGSIVLMASMSASICNVGVNTCAYNSSKSALLQLARSLAREWGSCQGMPTIRVNTLSPGYIRTEATRSTLEDDPDMDRLWTGTSMLGRLSFAHEFRAPVLFLLSDANSFMTAADLRVDGGCTAW